MAVLTVLDLLLACLIGSGGTCDLRFPEGLV